jgi:hypothetical protein
VFEAFLHAPFADDCAAARNETSLAMQITLKDPSGSDGKVLLLGDLAHDTIMKIGSCANFVIEVTQGEGVRACGAVGSRRGRTSGV